MALFACESVTLTSAGSARTSRKRKAAVQFHFNVCFIPDFIGYEFRYGSSSDAEVLGAGHSALESPNKYVRLISFLGLVFSLRCFAFNLYLLVF